MQWTNEHTTKKMHTVICNYSQQLAIDFIDLEHASYVASQLVTACVQWKFTYTVAIARATHRRYYLRAS